MNRRIIGLLVMMACALHVTAQNTILPRPGGSKNFGWDITVLPNGNYVVTDVLYSEGGLDNLGAVYLYDGKTNALISTLKGSQAGDNIGIGRIAVLPNSNFLVCSPYWDNAPAFAGDAGAVTFVNGTTGLNGVVNSSNSLVGGSAGSSVGYGGPVIILPNGNYVVQSMYLRNGSQQNVGAVTWGSGTTGVSGTISSANSLIGVLSLDVVGATIKVLPNSNYVVISPTWDNGAVADAGAVTWCDGSTGRSGFLGSSNSLVGSNSGDQAGSSGITVLSNGNYIIRSPNWKGSTGAVTWCDGNTGRTGNISSANSLVGNLGNDKVGSVTPLALSNGNYVVCSPEWDNGAIADVGAVTWCNGATGLTGTVNAANSLTGSVANDQVGSTSPRALSNGNYVLLNPNWDNGAIVNAGAVTWCNGTTGLTGVVSPANSLVGSSASDLAGAGLSALTNGNYVVYSPNWDNGAVTNVGAVTWCNGTTGLSGTVSTLNSLVGSTADDQAGTSGILALSNGNYVVISTVWHNGAIVNAGAVTWCNGTTGLIGTISPLNSLVGSTANDLVGATLTPLTNGNYIVSSPNWDNGAVVNAGAATWCNGTTGLTGTIGSSNSLVGSTASDQVGNVSLLKNGNYIVRSQNWDNGAAANAGAVTWGNGATGVSGVVGSSISLVGSTAGDQVGSNVALLDNGNYVVQSPNWDNGAVVNAGAVTLCNGSAATSGPVSTANSLYGTIASSTVGSGSIVQLTNGNYVVGSPSWRNGALAGLGAATWCNTLTGLTTGAVTAQNSLVGSSANDNVGLSISALTNGHYMVMNYSWDNGTVVNAGGFTWGNGNAGTFGPVTSCNSIIGVGNSTVSNGYIYPYNKMIVAEFDSSFIGVYQPDGMGLAVSGDTIAVNMNGTTFTPLVAASGCRLITTLTPGTAASRISGPVSAKVWIESGVPVNAGVPYVARHYQITPDNNAASATSRITLYCTQQEFDDYNVVSTQDLPVNASDAAGKSRLRVVKYPGVSNNNSGLPASYTGTPVELDPADADIVWNTGLSRWEISFDVTGFSGFFIQALGASVPLRLLQFNALLNNNDVLVNWKTTNEVNVQGFDIERSIDGRNFSALGFTPATNRSGDHSYLFTDVGAALLNTQKLYYRLKQKDIDGRIVYSQIVMVRLTRDNSISVYPNPATNAISISIGNSALLHTAAFITDMQGKMIKQFTINNYQQDVDISKLAHGLFIIKFQDGTAIKLEKE